MSNASAERSSSDSGRRWLAATRKRTTRLELDHALADAAWRRRVDADASSKRASSPQPIVPDVEVAPYGFENQQRAYDFVSLLGNCLLLLKSFNISKSDRPMWAFLEEVHEFKRADEPIARESWEQAMSFMPALTDPTSVSLDQIAEAILARDVASRKAPSDFVNGTRVRQDVGPT